MSVGNRSVTPGAAPPAAADTGGSTHDRRKFLILAVAGVLSWMLFAGPLDKTSQWAGILSLSGGFWSAAIGYLPRVRVPWRKVAIIAAVVLVVAGGAMLANAYFQASRAIEMPRPSFDGRSAEDVWSQRTTGVLTLPPPYREHARLTFVLQNTRPQAGDCVYPAALTLTPVIDGQARPDDVRTTRSGQSVDIPLDGTESRAQVHTLLSYPDDGPVTCRVRVMITKAVLHG
ncbi:hypothetical protein [Actinoplanes sp. NPDC048796]|uniref:hypothetical protein n=1 Tax=Actinoplanes sp. NPDC048796 TaxID=3155640 RepID=UPI0033F7C860